MYLRLFFLCLLHILSQDGDAQNNPILGSWINQLGSVLVIDSVGTDQQIYGQYLSSSGVDGKTFGLMGYINQREDSVIGISFTVHWGEYGSITTWSGYLDHDENGPYIKTMWLLVRPSEKNDWERIITNSSTFRPSIEEE